MSGGAGPIRVLAVAVIRSGDRLLVERGHDAASGQRFWRAIGGGVEFGERARDAVAREWREEYGLRLLEPRLVGVVENLFTYEGRAGHEVAFVFRAAGTEPSVEDRDAITSRDAEGLVHDAAWVPIGELHHGGAPLYPDGVLALLADPE